MDYRVEKLWKNWRKWSFRKKKPQNLFVGLDPWREATA